MHNQMAIKAKVEYKRMGPGATVMMNEAQRTEASEAGVLGPI